ncbi:hypothetical protein [Sphingomonas oligophenolica]
MKTAAPSLNRLSPLNRVSLLCAMVFAVIAEAFRCSAVRFRCYRITAKTAIIYLIKNRNISNKIAKKAPEKISFPVLSLFRPDNSVNGGIRGLAEIPRQFGHAAWRHEELVHAKARKREEYMRPDTPRTAAVRAGRCDSASVMEKFVPLSFRFV